MINDPKERRKALFKMQLADNKETMGDFCVRAGKDLRSEEGEEGEERKEGKPFASGYVYSVLNGDKTNRKLIDYICAYIGSSRVILWPELSKLENHEQSLQETEAGEPVQGEASAAAA